MIPLDDLVVGTVVLVLSSCLITLYAVCLKAMLASKDLMKNSCYIFMIQLGIVDILQLVGMIIGGIMTLSQSTGPYPFNPLCGAILMDLGWNTALSFVHLLAFNRFIISHGAQYYSNFLFGKRGRKIFSAIPWIVGCLFMTLCLIINGYIYDLWSYTWYYNFNIPQTSLVVFYQKAQFWNTTIQTVLIVLWYSLMLVAQKLLKNQVNTPAAPTSAGQKERVASLTAGLVCGVLVLSVIVFNLVPHLPWKGKYVYLSVVVTCELCYGMNPIIYLSLNKTIRNRVKKMLAKKLCKTSVIAPTTSQTRPSQARTSPWISRSQRTQNPNSNRGQNRF